MRGCYLLMLLLLLANVRRYLLLIVVLLRVRRVRKWAIHGRRNQPRYQRLRVVGVRLLTLERHKQRRSIAATADAAHSHRLPRSSATISEV